jgi:hypothetical protein
MTALIFSNYQQKAGIVDFLQISINRFTYGKKFNVAIMGRFTNSKDEEVLYNSNSSFPFELEDKICQFLRRYIISAFTQESNRCLDFSNLNSHLDSFLTQKQED